jgi:hypothetical protein
MQKFIENLSSDELLPALESNMAAFWSAYGVGKAAACNPRQRLFGFTQAFRKLYLMV